MLIYFYHFLLNPYWSILHSNLLTWITCMHAQLANTHAQPITCSAWFSINGICNDIGIYLHCNHISSLLSAGVLVNWEPAKQQRALSALPCDTCLSSCTFFLWTRKLPLKMPRALLLLSQLISWQVIPFTTQRGEKESGRITDEERQAHPERMLKRLQV